MKYLDHNFIYFVNTTTILPIWVRAGVMEDFAGSFEAEGRWKKEEAREEPGDFAEALKQKTCHMVCWHGLKLVMWVYLHRLRLVK